MLPNLMVENQGNQSFLYNFLAQGRGFECRTPPASTRLLLPLLTTILPTNIYIWNLGQNFAKISIFNGSQLVTRFAKCHLHVAHVHCQFTRVISSEIKFYQHLIALKCELKYAQRKLRISILFCTPPPPAF